MAVRSFLGGGTAAALGLVGVADPSRRGRSDRPMIDRLAGALLAAAMCAGAAACGDTRSDKDLGGVATWPMGGPAHGAWADSPPATTGYGSSGTATTETTTTTTTVRPDPR